MSFLLFKINLDFAFYVSDCDKDSFIHYKLEINYVSPLYSICIFDLGSTFGPAASVQAII